MPGEDRVSLSAVPYPAAIVTVDGGDPVLGATTDAFEAAFGPVDAGTPVGAWWAAAGLDGGSVEAVCDALVEGDDFETEVTTPAEGDSYRLRTTSDDGTRTLWLTRDAGVGADRLATVVSHDLRNPLDVAEAHLQAARETGEERHFDSLGAAHDRMERIIEDVLTLARGDSTVDPVPRVDVGDVAADAWATVDTQTATVDVVDGLPTVEADPDRLQRLFENLFRNSVEHGRLSEGDITVTVTPTDDGFAVVDDGPGIDPVDRQRVFEPGYTGDGSGTGLGLTIVERIAQAHGWTVDTVDSDGARFTFQIDG